MEIGGQGGNANTTFSGESHPTYYTYGVEDSGDCGGNGENCGIVNINNNVKVFAYGGAGGGSALEGSDDSGAGGGGYPAAGIGRRWSRWRSEETIAAVLDGYTSGIGQSNVIGGKNGEGNYTDSSGDFGLGGGYYSYGTRFKSTGGYASWFGEGGCVFEHGRLGRWSTAGSGGTAGQGGIIKYSETSEIHAYNGNMITEDEFDYDTPYYEYDKDGKYLDGTSERETKVASVVTFINNPSKKIIPAKIFIQDGIRRAVYDNLCYMSEERKQKYGVSGEISADKIKNSSQDGKIQNVRIIDEELNVTHSQQGIGSGAGYIEVSNGTYEVDPSLN